MNATEEVPVNGPVHQTAVSEWVSPLPALSGLPDTLPDEEKRGVPSPLAFSRVMHRVQFLSITTGVEAICWLRT